MKAARPLWPALIISTGAGSAAGALAKLADQSAFANRLGLNDLGTYLGVWIVAIAVLVLVNRTRRAAVLSAVAFFAGMVLAYYGVTRLLFGFWPWRPFLVWIGLAVTAAPLLTALAYDTTGSGWRGAFGAALPVGLLLWEAYSLRLTLPLHATQFGFDLAAGIVLFVVFVKRWGRGWETAVFVLAIFAIANIGSRILPYTLGVYSA